MPGGALHWMMNDKLPFRPWRNGATLDLSHRHLAQFSWPRSLKQRTKHRVGAKCDESHLFSASFNHPSNRFLYKIKQIDKNFTQSSIIHRVTENNYRLLFGLIVKELLLIIINKCLFMIIQGKKLYTIIAITCSYKDRTH